MGDGLADVTSKGVVWGQDSAEALVATSAGVEDGELVEHGRKKLGGLVAWSYFTVKSALLSSTSLSWYLVQ